MPLIMVRVDVKSVTIAAAGQRSPACHGVVPARVRLSDPDLQPAEGVVEFEFFDPDRSLLSLYSELWTMNSRPRPTVWEVRVAYVVGHAHPQDVDRLSAGFDGAEGGDVHPFLEDRGTSMSIGVVLLIAASDPGEAVTTGVRAFDAACRRVGIRVMRLDEVVVRDSSIDPRL
jgi:hypothetical protein